MSVMVTKIDRIRNLGVFRDFAWPGDLQEFRRYNLVYGWNGTGKTLLSSIFEALQAGAAPTAGDIAVTLNDDRRLSGTDFPNVVPPLQVRVFNRDFVSKNVFGTRDLIGPIFVLGGHSVEQQQELERVVAKLGETEMLLGQRESQKNDKETELDSLCTNGARLVRETLRSTGQDIYANYERPRFRDCVNRISMGEEQGEVQTESEFERLTKVIRSEPKSAISPVPFSFRSYATFAETTRMLCESSVATTVIDELRDKPDVNLWVQQGMDLHREHGSHVCLFCAQDIPRQRLSALENHFNDQYTRLLEQIRTCAAEVRAARETAERMQLPDDGRFFPSLQEDYRQKRRALASELREYAIALRSLEDTLRAKEAAPFKDFGDQVGARGFSEQALERVNQLIVQHNSSVTNREAEVTEARRKLELSLVAERLVDYRRIKQELAQLDSQVAALRNEAEELKKQREELERSIVETQRPADELNTDLASYLGYSELKFEVAATGYRIVRGAESADCLSEGEKTAIALLYFLKTLEDKSFSKANGIVVVDDPVSSLDSNSLYHAFGFIKARVKNVGQLLILTHSFLFFRLVKEWFRHLRNGDVSYYMLQARLDAGRPKSSLAGLDRLLRDYETEYHYLFSLVFHASQHRGVGDGLQGFHFLPNVARRVLEAFLEFKVPGKEGLHGKLEQVDFDMAKKTRILRFCDTHSHNRVADEAETDPSVLARGPEIARDLLDLIASVDSDHFDRMKALVDVQT